MALLDKRQILTLTYHDLFGYPLTKNELLKWRLDQRINFKNSETKIAVCKANGFYFFKGKKTLVQERLKRRKLSQEKFKIAKKAARLLKSLPTVKLLAITGSLAMENARSDSDIDLLIITQRGTLWLSRLLIYAILSINNFSFRRAGDKNEENKLCLNMWFDEKDLVWEPSERNIFTAHEIAQIVPLINKEKTYELFIYQNKWLFDYWPRAVNLPPKVSFSASKRKILNLQPFITTLNGLSFILQYLYMKPKITREVVTPTRAFFHPINWSGVVLKKLLK